MLVSIIDHLTGEHKPYVLTDIIAFVCLVVFIFKLKAEQGQSRMTRVMRSILQDGILYFLIMTAFHITMLFFTVIRKVIPFILLVEGWIMTSRHPSLLLIPRL